MLKLQDFRSRAKGLPDLLPWAALIAPDIVLQKDGSLLAAWEIRGEDTDSSTPEELEYVSTRVNTSVMHMGSGWMLHVDAVRMPERAYPAREESHFPDRVTALIEEERREIFSQGQFFRTTTMLSVTYKPPLMADRLVTAAVAMKTAENALEKSLATFRNGIKEVEDAFSAVVRMSRLGEYGEADADGQPHAYSALLAYLQFCAAGEYHPVLVPHTPMYLDGLLETQDVIGGLSPRLGDKWLAVLGLDGLPQESLPAMLAALEALPIPYRFSTRFMCLDQFEAQIEVDKYRKTWRQQIFRFFDMLFGKANPRANRDAARMAEDAEEAYADVQGGLLGMGFYSANVVLLHEDPERLEEWCRTLRRMIQALGFGCRSESINALEAWLGTHPGNWWANVRRPLISTMNLADLLPLATIWPGREYNPCAFYPRQSPPLTFCATNGSTYFRLNLHVGDLGHTLIFGPTGAGKSTLLGLLAAQFRRYEGGTVYCFDKGMSMYPLTKGICGLHLEVGGDGSPAFCPLYHLETGNDASWAEEWLATLCELQGLHVMPAHRNAIHSAVAMLADNPPPMRSLTDFYHLVQDRDIKASVQHYTEAGAMGRLLDAQEDTMRLHDFMTFELEELMKLEDKNVIPVLLYLFHRIEQSFFGQPSLLILDEAWIMLGHPVFQAKIREWLKVLRKANCAVVLSTQSLSDAMNSPIMDVLIESCPTKFLLPNKHAREATQKPLYLALGLNERQLEIVATARRKQDYYVVSPEGRRLISLALGPKTLAFIGASDKESIARIKALEREYGDAWVDKWLEERHAA